MSKIIILITYLDLPNQDGLGELNIVEPVANDAGGYKSCCWVIAFITRLTSRFYFVIALLNILFLFLFCIILLNLITSRVFQSNNLFTANVCFSSGQVQ
jgi:hypothetical protein